MTADANPGVVKEGLGEIDRTGLLITTALFTALTVAGAFLRLPIHPVPITLQTIFVLLSGYLLGSYYGALSQFLYLLIGLVGFPVFSQGGGPAYVFKPSFGYLLGFPVAAFLVGRIIHKKSTPISLNQTLHQIQKCSITKIVIAGLSGSAAIFALGVLYLYLISRFVIEATGTIAQIMYSGFLIFIPGDLIKLLAVVLFLKFLSKRVRR